jgi:hypothetical protein
MIKRISYTPRSQKQLLSWYKSRTAKGISDFTDFAHFMTWYCSQKKICFYCGVEEEVCQILVLVGRLSSNRFPEDGVLARGRCRGVWLEIDRLNPRANYSVNNSALCCYFCNNDKSDIFSAEEYKHFFQNRANYLRALRDQLGV